MEEREATVIDRDTVVLDEKIYQRYPGLLLQEDDEYYVVFISTSQDEDGSYELILLQIVDEEVFPYFADCESEALYDELMDRAVAFLNEVTDEDAETASLEIMWN